MQMTGGRHCCITVTSQ